ncbi:MAG: hypothetical protein ACI4SM_04435 [Candidatus Gastranaerophilaceae bacterium]
MNENNTLTRNIINFDDDMGAALLRTILLAKSNVPYSHKRTADNYVVIKRMYKFHTVKATVSLSEYDLLKKYWFKPLECTTVQEANDEIAKMKQWSASNNEELKRDSDNIIIIRAKELKNITASAYSNIPKEMYNGYKALEKYFEEITKFYR